MAHIKKFVILIFCPLVTHALYGFDCSAPRAEMTQVSLNEVGKCDIAVKQINSTKTNLQLLQLTSYTTTHVHYCYLQITRLVTHCGYWEYSSAVEGGLATYLKELSRDECLWMHESGRANIYSNIVDNVKPNSTTRFHLTLGGSLNSDGDCTGVYYADQYGSWSHAVVQADGLITLADYDVSVKLEEETLITHSGVHCAFNKGKCFDHNGGTLYWDFFPSDPCEFDKYTVLYEGVGDKMISNIEGAGSSTIVAVTSEDITFALTTLSSITVCGYTITRTEHPRLFIVEGAKGSFFKSKINVKTNDLDLFNYVNSKFVYIEKHFRAQIETLYRDVLLKRCELERKVLKNSQSIAMLAPDEFSMSYLGEVGWTAVLGGELIFLIKCVPVQVTLAKTERCYQELPVRHNNRTMFLSPRTRILKSVGYEVTCNNILPISFNVDGTWFRMTPAPVQTTSPIVLQPSYTASWEYSAPNRLAKSGIYSSDDLQRLRDYLMQPREQPAIVNTLARLTAGQKVSLEGLHLRNLIDEATVERIAANAWSRLWGVLKGLGDITSGLLGTYMLCRAIKLAIDTAFHFLSLKAAYGWSFCLLGALFDSLTNFLLFHKHRKESNTNNNDPEDPRTPDDPIPIRQLEIEEPKVEEPSTSKTDVSPSAPSENNTKDTTDTKDAEWRYETLTRNRTYPELPPRPKPKI